MTKSRTQIALVAADVKIRERLAALGRLIENDSYTTRVPDFPAQLDDSTMFETVTRTLLLAGGKLPHAIVAVTGDDKQIADSAKLFMSIRKRVATVLVLCPKGYEYMKRTVDLPNFATGCPPHSHSIKMAILIGAPRHYPEYNMDMFGRPIYLAMEMWNDETMEALAGTIRSAMGGPIAC